MRDTTASAADPPAGASAMDLFEWLLSSITTRCWVCQGGEFDEDGQEVRVKKPGAGAAGDPPPRPSSLLVAQSAYAKTPSSAEPSMEQTPSRSPDDKVDKDQERQRLRELMKEFANRGMQGVRVELLNNAADSLRPGCYHLDEKLEGLTITPVDDPSAGSQAILFMHVIQVLRAVDVEPLQQAGFSGETLQALSVDQRNRLLVIVYNETEDPDNQRVTCFLEASAADRKRFVTCVRILRQYIAEVASVRPS